MKQKKYINNTIKKIFLTIQMCVFGLLAISQNVTNITATQVGKTIHISYDLDQTADITLHLSMDGGQNYQQLYSVSGDTGKNVSAGHRTIVWDVLSERENFKGDNIIFKVQARNNQLIKFKNEDLMVTIKGVTFKMIYVKGGSFNMGIAPERGSLDADPIHMVTLTNDYWIGETEVNQELWVAIMGSNPSIFKGDNLPVNNVSWNDCQEFIQNLNALTNNTYRLPTEAEWEYAARGGQKTQGYKYAGGNDVSNVAWYNNNSGGIVHPIKTKQPNELGIYDMTGNVTEWCQDFFGKYLGGLQIDPTGPKHTPRHVLRGGDYQDIVYSNWIGGWLRVNRRCGDKSKHSFSAYGFRLVLVQE